MPDFMMTPLGLSSGRTGGAALEDSFDRFLAAMVAAGGKGYSRERMLRPGQERAAVASTLREHGVEPLEELVAYWTLHDGMRRDATAHPPLGPWWPSSLRDALFTRERRTAGWVPGRMDPEEGWMAPEWIELTVDHPLVACTNVTGDGGCVVRRIDPGVIDFHTSAPSHQLSSICTVFDLITEGIKTGQIYPVALSGRPLAWGWGQDPKGWSKLTHDTWTI